MRNYVQPGYKTNYAHSAAVVSGQAVLVGTELLVATGAFAANEEGVYLRAGVVTLPKVAAQAQSKGVLIYWDDTNKNLTTTATNNTLAGIVDVAALAADTEVAILLNGLPYAFN